MTDPHTTTTVEADVAWCPTCTTYTRHAENNPTQWATGHTQQTGHLTYQRTKTLTTRTTEGNTR